MKSLLKIFITLPIFFFAQEDIFENYKTDSIELESTDLDDSTIELDDAQIYHVVLETDLEKKYYLWLRKRVLDVWPYVLSVQKEYYNISDSAQLIENKRERKKYIKSRKKNLSDKFEKRLKELSTSRGQILCKLIHRETDKTVHEMIKEMRGGVNAFLWNAAGGAFKIDTKVEFDPKKTREDLYIEVILRRAFASNILQRYEDADWAKVEQQLNKTKAKKMQLPKKKEG